MYRMSQKLIASILVMVIMLAECSLIGFYGGKVYAEDSGFETQKTKINNADAEFDAYFVEDQNKVHEARKQIEDQSSIYASINVNSGYIKDAQIKFTSENEQDANFKLAENVNNAMVQTIDTTNSVVKLNQVNNGNAKIIEIPIFFKYAEKILPSEFARIVKAVFTGTYVDNNGKETKVEKEISLYLIWKTDIHDKGYLNESISKFIPYEVGDNKGVILEETINTKVEGNVLPTKKSNIEIDVPSINNIKPTSINVYASTDATNGDKEGYNFTRSNYTYEEETNKLTITVENKQDSDGKVLWKKDAIDEYKVIYIFPEEAKQIVENEGANIERKVKSTINLYSAGEAKTTNTLERQEILRDVIGNITNFKVEGKVANISKGQIYANYVAIEKLETIYNEDWVAQIALPTLVDKVVLETESENVLLSGENTLQLTNSDIYYKKVSMKKKDLEKILGQEAQIKIYSGNTLITTINKDFIETVNEENIAVDLSQLNVNTIRIETSKPVLEGKLTFNIEKAIKGTLSKTKAQMNEAQSIKGKVKVSSLNGQSVLEERILENVIPFTEPETKASIVINKENLSTVVKNENVELKAILSTDSLNNRLYKNPTLTIELPKYIEEVQIKDAKILFDNELIIASTNVVNNTNGSKSIIVNLTGEQTKYSIGSVTGGANVIIKADLTVNKLTSNRTENIIMTYTNLNETGSKSATTSINFVAPVGVITTSSIENYASGKEKLTSMSGSYATAEIEILTKEVDAKFNMSVINNYDNTISNVSILGKIPSKTFDMKLKSPITVKNIDESRVKVYYSTNKDADKDLNKQLNEWTLNIENYELVKSYLIVIEGNLNTAESIDFEYTAQVPANLNYNEEAIESYTAYFTNNLETGAIEDSQASTPITITTGLGPIIEAQINSNIGENDVVLSANKIKYTIKVQNTGTKEANNVKLTFDIPDNTKYIEYIDIQKDQYIEREDSSLEFEIGKLNPTETVEKEIYVKVQREDDQEYEINAKAIVTADEFEDDIQTNTVTNRAKKSTYNISVHRQVNEEKDLETGEDFTYLFYVSTPSYVVETSNTVLETKIPEGLIYKDVKVQKYDIFSNETEQLNLNTNYNQNTRVLRVDLGTVTHLNRYEIIVNTTVDSLNENEYSRDITLKGTVKSGDIQENSQEKIYRIVKEALEITQVSNIPTGSKISQGEQIVYTVNLKNKGAKFLEVNLKDVLPKALTFEKLTYDLSGKEMTYTYSSDNTVEYTFYLAEGETKQVRIYAVAQIVPENTEVTNVINARTNTLSNIESNPITYIIEKPNYVIDDPNDNQEEEQEEIALVKLGGVIWKDENKNGIKEAGEDLLEGIEVVLLDTKTNKLFEQDENIVKVRTDANGIYTFENVPSGNYIVIFLYDTAKYSATSYKQAEADEYTNSDAIDTKIKLNGNNAIAAVTDTITLNNSNQYNIDLGLVDNPKFDLKLDMKISKITVRSGEETKVYEYENTNLAKLEFVEKYLNGSTIVVEYTIKVTNEGALEGKVKKIADYLPKELSFSSELNRDWYENENGTVYNASLANTKILPGETKEVKLLLTKVVNENSLGTINNNAEIYEAYNDEGILDVDSTPANQNSSEDDYTSADLVLSIKTGRMVMFIGLTLTIITIIGTSAYFIKKKVLR